jgi:hypothetical protein
MVENALKSRVELNELESPVLTVSKERVCYLCDHPLDSEDDSKTPDSSESVVIVLSPNQKEILCKLHFSEASKSSEWINAWESDTVEMCCSYCRELIEELLNCPLNPIKLSSWVTVGRLAKLKALGILRVEDVMELEEVFRK